MLPSPSTAEPSVTTNGNAGSSTGARRLGSQHRHADLGNTRCVAWKIIAVLERDFRGDFDLAAKVEQEGAVGHFLDAESRVRQWPW